MISDFPYMDTNAIYLQQQHLFSTIKRCKDGTKPSAKHTYEEPHTRKRIRQENALLGRRKVKGLAEEGQRALK